MSFAHRHTCFFKRRIQTEPQRITQMHLSNQHAASVSFQALFVSIFTVALFTAHIVDSGCSCLYIITNILITVITLNLNSFSLFYNFIISFGYNEIILSY